MADTFDEPGLAKLRDLAAARDGTPMPAGLLGRLRNAPFEPEAVTLPMPATVGVYRIIAERGRGGMGVVYEAVDDKLHRRVAVKMLVSGPLADARSRERFQREARTAAGLRHDHLVPVFAAETPADGPAYLVMPFIDGPTLADRIAAERVLDFDTAARIAWEIADGLAAVHAAGIVHRDVKPGNVLIDSADGRAKLTDFGLARGDTTGQATTAGSVAGTPNYLSPEQIHSPDAVDARADVYALGATLYECLTGVPPFRGSTLEMLKLIGTSEPVPPRRLRPGVPRDLETIALKCLEKDPARRYASAAALRGDLGRYRGHVPILARPAGRIERTRRWTQRNPGAAAVIAVSIVGAVTAGLGWTRAAAKTAEAETARDDALQARRKSEERSRLALGTIDTMVNKAQRLADRSPATLNLKRELAETALGDLKTLAAEEEPVEGVRLTLLRTHAELGKIYHLLGRGDDARRLLDDGLALAGTLPPAEGDTAVVHELVSTMHYQLTGHHRNAGRVDAARAHADAGIAAIERARTLAPDEYSLARQAAVSYNSRGDIAWFVQGRSRDALPDYRRALALCEGMLPRHAEKSQVHRDIAFTADRLARLHVSRYEFPEAERHSRAALAASQAALALAPQNAMDQRSARIAVLDRSQVLFNAGDFAEAERLARSVAAEIAAAALAEPARLDLQRDVAVADGVLGNALQGLGRLDDAATLLRQSFDRREGLGAYAVSDLVEIGQLILNNDIRRGRYDLLPVFCERLLKVSETLDPATPPTAVHAHYRRVMHEGIRAAPLMAAVIADPATLERQPADLRPWLACQLAYELAKQDRVDEARRVLAAHPGDPADAGRHCYYTVLIASVAAGRAKADAERERYLADALAAVKTLFKAHQHSPASLLVQTEFLPLRSYAPFMKLVAESN